jgi:hypothetical protein
MRQHSRHSGTWFQAILQQCHMYKCLGAHLVCLETHAVYLYFKYIGWDRTVIFYDTMVMMHPHRPKGVLGTFQILEALNKSVMTSVLVSRLRWT